MLQWHLHHEIDLELTKFNQNLKIAWPSISDGGVRIGRGYTPDAS